MAWKTKKKDRKEHGRSTWNSEKRKDLIDLIKRDVTQKDACAYVGLPTSTLHDWLNRDELLSEEYMRAESFMDIATSNAISTAILNKKIDQMDKAKLSMDWKKRRDRRYTDKSDTTSSVQVTIDPEKKAELDEFIENNL